MKIERLAQLKAKLHALEEGAKKQTLHSVSVGYTAAYAVYVHENTEEKLKGHPRPGGKGTYWGPNGQSKFLEAPARLHQAELGEVVAQVTKATGSVTEGLMAAGLLLQRMSQKLVPVLTGNLKNSAFTRLETFTQNTGSKSWRNKSTGRYSNPND